MNPNKEISIRFKEKFEFYVIALTFTILGLSIQTASFGVNSISNAFELLGWLFLFVSGLAGLSRLEWVPVAYDLYSDMDSGESELARLRQAQQMGATEIPVVDDERDMVPIDEAIQVHDNNVMRLKPKIQKISKWIQRKYQIHKWSFVLGLFFLFLSRSYGPAMAIVDKVLGVK